MLVSKLRGCRRLPSHGGRRVLAAHCRRMPHGSEDQVPMSLLPNAGLPVHGLALTEGAEGKCG